MAQTQCCIAGGGPAGLMLGVLLARAGCRVIVLEKHADFLRDFRGDTIHPSTMEVMHELGLLDAFLKLPHQKVARLTAMLGDTPIQIADFSHLPVQAPYIAMMPQWDFLNFMAREGRTYPGFELRMNAQAEDLIVEGERIVGVSGQSLGAPFEIRAGLVVAADGRASVLREKSGLKGEDFGAPMDALWFRLPRVAGDTDETVARFEGGRIFIMLNRGDYWQCAYVIPKGANAALRAAGLAAFQASVAASAPFVAERARGIASFDDVKLLTVQVDRLKRWWRPGFLCIGDAAHAMSPVGGVGVNLAVQDAVAAANLLAEAVREGRVGDAELAAVEARRAWPTRMTQALQLAMQRQIIAPVLGSKAGALRVPLPLRLLQWVPLLRRLPARAIGLGVRPEHISAALRSAR
jgi:2-polyprenyl-6-methoxyphenol hydroxylase-like FAD-dependent oxidoreductase